MAEIKASGSLDVGVVTATLRLGDATLTLSFPRDDDQAASDMADLVDRSEDAFTQVLEALILKAEAQEVTNG